MASIVERKPVMATWAPDDLTRIRPKNEAAVRSPATTETPAVVPLGDREQRDQGPETLVGDLSLDEVRVGDRRGDRHDEDGDRPPTTDDQRQRLEQQERDAERVGLAGRGRAGSQRDERQRRQPQGDRRVDEPGHQVLGRARASRHPDSVRAAPGGHIIPGVDSGTRPGDEPRAGSPSRYAGAMDPALATATAADGTRIAWTSVGDGPTLIHMPGVPFSNVEGEWRIPLLRRLFTDLGGQVRFIQYDGRGTGRSQRDVSDFSLEAYVGDLDAVVEASGAGQVVLLGFFHSVTHAIAWAARHPERVRGLVLFGGALRGWDPMQGPGTQALLSLIERDWDTFVESAAHAWLGWPEGDEGRLAADWFRTATTPAIARATLQAAYAIDVTADAADVRCPALVLHRVDATVIPFDIVG